MKICRGARGSVEVDAVAEEDVVEGIRRFGRGKIGRDAMRDGWIMEEVGDVGYCWGGRTAVDGMLVTLLESWLSTCCYSKNEKFRQPSLPLEVKRGKKEDDCNR